MPIYSSVFPTLSCSGFKVSSLILRSLISFELIFVQGERHRSNFSFLHADNPVFLATFVEEAVFSIVGLGQLYEKLGDCSCMDLCLGLLFCPLVFNILFLLQVQLRSRSLKESCQVWASLVPQFFAETLDIVK
jgi:hypothetical protein